MKLLFISTSFPPDLGGIATFALAIARGLCDRGEQVHVLSSYPRQGELDPSGIRVTRTPGVLNKKGIKIIPLATAASLVSQRERPDLVLAMTWTHEGTVAYALRSLFGIPYVIVAHGSELRWQNSSAAGGWLMRRVLLGARGIIANSEFTRRAVINLGIDEANVHVLHPPVIPFGPVTGSRVDAAMDTSLGIAGKRVLLTTARLVARKGHAEILRVLARLVPRYPDLVYVMTGEGPVKQSLVALARELGIEERVRMPGFVPREMLSYLYQRAEIYISPSSVDDGDYEGFGISFLEAGLYRLPVIAGRSGGAPEAVLHRETGILVQPQSLSEVEAALVELLDDSALRERLGQTARERILTDLTVESQAARLQSLLTRIISSAHAR